MRIHLVFRTYERGVEDETLSCGTGVTAVALAMHNKGITTKNEVLLNVEGGVFKSLFLKRIIKAIKIFGYKGQRIRFLKERLHNDYAKRRTYIS